jgi:hypothetical protein
LQRKMKRGGEEDLGEEERLPWSREKGGEEEACETREGAGGDGACAMVGVGMDHGLTPSPWRRMATGKKKSCEGVRADAVLGQKKRGRGPPGGMGSRGKKVAWLVG